MIYIHFKCTSRFTIYENHDIAITMSSFSCADTDSVFKGLNQCHSTGWFIVMINKNHDIAIAMSSSRADPVLGMIILQG